MLNVRISPDLARVLGDISREMFYGNAEKLVEVHVEATTVPLGPPGMAVATPDGPEFGFADVRLSTMRADADIDLLQGSAVLRGAPVDVDGAQNLLGMAVHVPPRRNVDRHL